jgi:hypothetical protein
MDTNTMARVEEQLNNPVVEALAQLQTARRAVVLTLRSNLQTLIDDVMFSGHESLAVELLGLLQAEELAGQRMSAAVTAAGQS